jgi:hypothetical protein
MFEEETRVLEVMGGLVEAREETAAVSAMTIRGR